MMSRKRGLWTYIKITLFLVIFITVIANIWFVLNDLVKTSDPDTNYSYDRLGNRQPLDGNKDNGGDKSDQARSTMVVEVNE